MVEGETKVMLGLESIVKAYLANPDSMWTLHREVMARTPNRFERTDKAGNRPVHMAYFYEQGCKKCGRALEIIGWLEKPTRMSGFTSSTSGKMRARFWRWRWVCGQASSTGS